MKKTTIDIFPNPASSKINVALKNPVSKNATWEINNTSGVKLKSGSVMNSSPEGRIEIVIDDLKLAFIFLDS
jgi:hypothetical protein